MAKPEETEEGFSVLSGGMNQSQKPRLIRPDQCALAINTAFRGGFATTRPPVLDVSVRFKTQEEQDWFERGIHQGAGTYTYSNTFTKSGAGDEVLIANVSGRAWVIELCTLTATEITPGGFSGRGSACGVVANIVQADNWAVIQQDGVSKPILWDGSISRRAKENEVPVGRSMAYGQGRLFVDSVAGLLAGDFANSRENAAITFKERLVLATRGDLAPSFVIGPISGMSFVTQSDTATGIGTLMLFGIGAATSLFAEKRRSEWADGIQRVVLPNIGLTGSRAITSVNGDLWFRSIDGIRSYRQARAQIDVWGQLPFSTEIGDILKWDAKSMLDRASMVYFDNRLLTTVSPRTNSGRVWHQGLVALDFDILTDSGKASKPAWDGVWTGLNISQIITTRDRCFLFVIDELGRNKIVELGASDVDKSGHDTIGSSTVDIRSTIISAGMVFNKAGGITNQKALIGGGLWLNGVEGRVTVDTKFRKDGETCWIDWATHELCAPLVECDATNPQTSCPQVFGPQYRNRLPLPRPEVELAISDDLPPAHSGNEGLSVASGYQFQAKISWTGRATVDIVSIAAAAGDKRESPGCADPDTCDGAILCCDSVFEETPQLPNYIPL